MTKLVTAIVAGVLLGIIGARYLFVGSWLSLIPWGIAGLALGGWCERREALINGAIYGFVLAFTFMIAGYAGSAPVISRLPFFAILGVIGAVFGFALGWIGNFLFGMINKGQKNIS
jgi:hypothetical protein